MSTAFLFPGQGSQIVGMGADLFDEFPEEVAEANEILGYSLSDLCINGPEEQLQADTTYPASSLFGQLFACTINFKDEGKPAMAAGHSVGEFAALAFAGAFTFSDGLKMVAKRGEIMSQVSGGGMAAVIALDAAKDQEVFASNGFTGIDLANFNSPGTDRDFRSCC